MKNSFTLFVLAFVLHFSSNQAQIPNAGFEQLNSNGTISNWGNVYLIPVWIDSMGVSHTDSIVYDNQLYAPTTDAHWGNTALELRNAWDYSNNHGIAGGVTADADSVYSSWGTFETIPVPIQMQPFSFSFFYKYFPVSNDTAAATLQVFDSSMNPLGEAVILISGTMSSYALATAPVIYATPGTVAFAYIHFSTAAYGTEPGFGTRFLVDDVMFNYVTGIHEMNNNDVVLYPNPAQDKINVSWYNSVNGFSVEIINSFGQLISTAHYPSQIDISDLAKGIYTMRIRGKDTEFLKRFMKSDCR